MNPAKNQAGLVFVSLFAAWAALAGIPATGPLHVSIENPRYFADPSGRIVYLTGSHTWSNLQDMGNTDPPPAFDYAAYLKFLKDHHHNFIRLWIVEHAWDPGDGNRITPLPWLRTGPGNALDGKPKFDLSRLDPAFFERLRQRVQAARDQSIYVSIMLFDDWSTENAGPWKAHPFHAGNNVNGIDGDPNHDGLGLEFHTLQSSNITRLQEAYVRKVVETVNDLDNVLYEVANETGVSKEWQYHFIRYIKRFEQSKPKQHPLGMTVAWPVLEVDNASLFASPADWISPNADGGYKEDPPAADGRKVILTDTDHLWGEGGDVQWVWKSFCRGLNPLYMDRIASLTGDARGDIPGAESVRNAMGATRLLAQHVNLAGMSPHGELSSTHYCLANPSVEYLVYQPKPGDAVALELKAGTYRYEWLNPSTGASTENGRFDALDGKREFKAPFEGESALYLNAVHSASRPTVYAWFPAHFGSWRTDGIDWDCLTHLCFRSVELEADGKVRRVSGNPPRDFVETAHRHGVKVTVLVWTRSRADSDGYLARFPQEAANNLLAYVKENNLDGLNIDDEQMGATNAVAQVPNRELVTRFFRILAKSFKAANPNYHITFAAPPVIDARDRFGTSWLDLKGIAEAIDGIIPMGYTQNPPSAGWTTNPEPLGGGGRAAWTTTRDIETMVRNYLDAMGGHKEKLLVGVSLKSGGYEWRCRTDQRLAPILDKGTWRSLEECEDKAREHGARWDERQKSSWYCYPDGDAFVQGWFNDARAWQAKLSWIDEQGLGGLGVWVLDGANDPPATWELLHRYSSLRASDSR
jgi:spore germination protein YaaH/predicted DNA-binding transcriptional regulator AlpA